MDGLTTPCGDGVLHNQHNLFGDTYPLLAHDLLIFDSNFFPINFSEPAEICFWFFIVSNRAKEAY